MIHDCGNGLLLPDCCIYRVPTTLRHLKEEAYNPKVVSIGPFHFRNERLQDMENHKRIMFKRFNQRTMSSLDDMVRLVKDLEPKVRSSYSETINFTKHELAKLTLLDAGFIIELFIMSCVTNEKGNDAKLLKPWLYSSIHQDLILLENQLPFFIIEELFNKAFPLNHDGSSRPSFLELTCMKKCLNSITSPQGGKPVSFIQFQCNGMKLKASKSKCLLDLKLSGHNTLEIPQILVEDDAEPVFRNMIALEQCHYPFAAYITDYALLLDCLVDTHKDVDLLVDKKIVSHCLGDSHNVASLFNGLWKNVTQSKFNSEYLDICQRLNSYCQDPRHRLKATLRRDYCNTPWRSVASIAGIILLVLTIFQTIFSVLQVVLNKYI